MDVFGAGRLTRSDHVDLAAIAALAVDQLAALFGPHARAKSDLPDALSVRNLVGVMHDEFSGSAQAGLDGSGHFHADFQLTALGFPHATATFLAGLLVITHALHVLDEAFLLAKFLKAAKHLLGRLVPA